MSLYLNYSQVIENLRFLMENTKSDTSRKKYEGLIYRFLRDSSPEFNKTAVLFEAENEAI